MSLIDEPEPPPSSKRYLIVGIVSAAVVLGGIFGVLALLRSGQPPTSGSDRLGAPSQAAREEPPRAAQASPPPSVPATAASPGARRARPTPAPAVVPATPPAPLTGTLTIESDVPGAMVFLDREFKGNAPVTIDGVLPGSHRLNLSAEGYEGYSEALDVVAGPNGVTVRFKDVKLNEAIPVTHKHTVGSCAGRLLADTRGLRYDTTNRNDAFVLTFSDLEIFEVDYLKKNLRVKQRGGRTYNFTGDSADTLFVFHKRVQSVREKLAKGDAPAPAKPK